MTRDQNFFWLVGLLEGEASFCRPSPSSPRSPIIDIEMCDADTMARIGALFGLAVRHRTRPKRPEVNDTYIVRLTGRRAVQLMWELRPYLSARRQAQIDRAMESYIARGAAYHPANMEPFQFRPVCCAPLCSAEAPTGWCEAHAQPARLQLVA